MDSLRECQRCDAVAYTRDDLELFQKASNAKYGRANLCKPCAVKKTLTNKAKRPPRTEEEAITCKATKRKWHLKKTYGITPEDFDRMMWEQEGTCKICKVPPYHAKNAFREFLVIDHDHSTGEVRGLLCMCCNTALGQFNDDINTLTSAIEYLK